MRDQDWFRGAPSKPSFGLGGDFRLQCRVQHSRSVARAPSPAFKHVISLAEHSHHRATSYQLPVSIASLIFSNPPFIRYSGLPSLSMCPLIAYPPHCLQEAYS